MYADAAVWHLSRVERNVAAAQHTQIVEQKTCMYHAGKSVEMNAMSQPRSMGTGVFKE